ncbi:NAD(P)H-dependent oxidoreductase [Paludibacter sp.]
MHLTDILNKRYASKQMSGEKLPKNKVDNILEAIRLAPTSKGLQPFKVFVVESQELKDKIFEIAAPGQPQVPKSSEVIIFACYKEITDDVLDAYYDLFRASRPMIAEEKASNYVYSIKEFIKSDFAFEWAARQAYLALGFGLVAAAVENVDSVPMEGFSTKALDELLNLNEQNLGSVCMLTIGYRDEKTDYNATLPKVRKDNQDLFIFL